MNFQLFGDGAVDGRDVGIHPGKLFGDENGNLLIGMGELHQIGGAGADFGLQHLILGTEPGQHSLRDGVALVCDFFRSLCVILHLDAAICRLLQDAAADDPVGLLKQRRIIIFVGRGCGLPQRGIQQQCHLLQILRIREPVGEKGFQVAGIADIGIDPVIHPDRLFVYFDALFILLDALLVDFDLFGIILLRLFEQRRHIGFLNRLKRAVHRFLQRRQKIVGGVENRVRGKSVERHRQHSDRDPYETLVLAHEIPPSIECPSCLIPSSMPRPTLREMSFPRKWSRLFSVSSRSRTPSRSCGIEARS